MRVLITASGIQDYIFAINAQAAGARLRGRSARLGLVVDYCLACLQEKYAAQFEVLRNAGGRLEVEFQQQPPELGTFLDELQRRLDYFSWGELRGQVWFTVAWGESGKSLYQVLARRKQAQGQTLLQKAAGQGPITWNEGSFLLPPHGERSLEKEEARSLAESQLGLALVRPHNRYVHLSVQEPRGAQAVRVVDRFSVITDTPPEHAPAWVLDDVGLPGPTILRKHLARYAPFCGERLCDFDEIATESSGVEFLGVLKADADNLGSTFAALAGHKGNDAKALSENLEQVFADHLDAMLQSAYKHCYVVYSGGDDLFLLGPWDQLLRFIDAFREKLKRAVESWGHPQLTLSAGFRLAHPKSPVRHLADDAEAALQVAKAHGKDCISVFERVLRWDELRAGINWADKLIATVQACALSAGFLKRMQFYGYESRRFHEGHEIDGLRMIPLLQNDWHRNIDRIGETLREHLNREVRPLLVQPTEKGERMWRIMDFAARFASYAIRERSPQNGRREEK
jgi:GGDEF domain-containing protein